MITPAVGSRALLPPVKAGAVFAGWHADEKLTQPLNSVRATEDNLALLDVYAAWQAVEYPVNYHLDGGANAAGNPATYTVHDSPVLHPATRAGDTFRGWLGGGYVQNLTSIPAGTTGNVAVVARWAPGQPQLDDPTPPGPDVASPQTGDAGQAGLYALLAAAAFSLALLAHKKRKIR